MKTILTLLLVPIWVQVACFGQTGSEVVVAAEISNQDSPINLYQFTGFGYALVPAKRKEQGESTILFVLPQSPPQFFYLGSDPNTLKAFLAGTEDTVRVKGDAKNPRGYKIVGSDLNDAYNQLLKETANLRAQANQVVRAYHKTSGATKDSLLQVLQETDRQQLDRLERLQAKDAFLARIAGFNTYLSFPNNEKGIANEIEYFAQTYFNYADLDAPGAAHSPWIYQSFFQYARVLASARIQEKQLQVYLDQQLEVLDTASAVQMLAYGGLLNALRQVKSPQFNHYAEIFIQRFQKSHPEITAPLAAELENNMRLQPGREAPNFSQITPEGESLSLKDLRGQVVLIDFWASWCGPCRKENPNVVRMYRRFKEKGFEIIGVSLDKSKERWLGAIEKDQLVWQHVSDLKGWRNEVALQYQVNSIPQTYLLDPNGKILAKNLRGAALEKKLEELFDTP